VAVHDPDPWVKVVMQAPLLLLPIDNCAVPVAVLGVTLAVNNTDAPGSGAVGEAVTVTAVLVFVTYKNAL
jgi:hypothetical protein